jgi:hypothetical protein
MDPGVDTGTASGMDFDVIAVLVVGVIWIGLFCWLAVVGWAKHRRLEREAYYRYETEKRLLSRDDAGAAQVLQLRNQEERTHWRKRRESLRLTGLIATTLGAGILVGLQFVDTGDVSLVGAGGFPLIVGLALLLYAYALYPKFTELDVDILPQQPSGGADNLRD